MKKLLKYIGILHFIFLILGGALVVSSLPFKTQYNMVNINVDKDGIEKADGSMTSAAGQNQEDLFSYMEENWNGTFNPARDPKGAVESKYTVYSFAQHLNETNTMILVYGSIVIICVLLLFFFQNANRKIYYKTNVFMSVVTTLAITAFGVVVLINLFQLMADVSAHYKLFNLVALLQDSTTKTDFLALNPKDWETMAFVNNSTLIGYSIGIVFVIVYAFFMTILTFSKYDRTRERRMEIIRKAVENND